MAYSRAWDETDPANANEASQGAQEIRELKVDIRERMEGMGIEWSDNDPIGQAFLGLIHGLEVSYKDADEVYVSSGVIHVNDGTYNHILSCTTQLTKAITGHGQSNKPIYFYVDTPDTIAALVAADIEWSNTAPTYSHAKGGWYHPTTTDLRFIGSIPVDDSGNLIKGYRSKGGCLWDFDALQTLDTGLTATSFTDIPNMEKFVPHIDGAIAVLDAMLYCAGAATTRTLSVRKNGSADANGRGFLGIRGDTFGPRNHCTVEQTVDVNGLAEYKLSASASTTAEFYLLGYWEPR